MTCFIFFLGGPKAVKGDFDWRDSSPRFPSFDEVDVANQFGISPPRDTYWDADPEFSQVQGFNSTAVIPLEIDENGETDERN